MFTPNNNPANISNKLMAEEQRMMEETKKRIYGIADEIIEILKTHNITIQDWYMIRDSVDTKQATIVSKLTINQLYGYTKEGGEDKATDTGGTGEAESTERKDEPSSN